MASEEDWSGNDEDQFGPSMPETDSEAPVQNDSEDEADIFCPALPPHLLKATSSSADAPKRASVVGPTLPPNYKPHSVDEYKAKSDEEKSEDENEVVGPLPSSADDDKRFNVPEMEDRFQRMIDGLSKDNKEPVREAWMLELPTNKPNILALGLGPRQFRKKNPQETGDRSVWTDTPQDKERKAKMKNPAPETDHSIEDVASRRRDEELAELVKKYDDKKRSAPLVDMHKQKKAKTEDSVPKQRKPFSREEDLQVNRFDEAQKETIMKKARQLNDRFSSGNRKFL